MNEDYNYISAEVVELLHKQWNEKMDYVTTHLVTWSIMLSISGIVLMAGYKICEWLYMLF